MKPTVIRTLTETFEGRAQQTEDGVEYWLARDLQHLLGYSKWDNFLNVVSKAQTACELSGFSVRDHFADVGKMVDLGSGGRREVDDLILTRYACYLVAQNGDPKKDEIAFAQTYFAMQTERSISSEHITDNDAVRKTLLSRGIHPEELLAAEDVRKVERRISSDEKASLTHPDALGAESGED